ncbi:MAG TPA: vWA domain-containing protein [Solirubrobacterales bacterium]|nr:vWA domain-containing protein [Solirubrobacterales bacterium]
MRRVGKLLLGPGVVALLVMGLIAAPAASAAPLASASACSSAKDIEAIIDDSGSMSITDPDRLRVQAMNLLIDDLSPNTQLGAVEFGSGIDIPGIITTPPANTVFPPGAVGANASAMRSALDTAIHADNGATDYNGAFAKSDADNPGADARIFLTDGGHDIGAYNEAHLVHKVPTYVIGFGTGISPGPDQARLKKIASDTGGKYFPVQDASQLQAAMNSIGAALTCQTPPRQFTDTLSNGQSKLHSITVGAATKTLQITLTWASPLDKFKLTGLRLVGKNGLIAVASRSQPPGKLKVTKTTSSTFTILKISKLRKGTLRFKVKAAKVGSSAKATLTTQVGQSTHK